MPLNASQVWGTEQDLHAFNTALGTRGAPRNCHTIFPGSTQCLTLYARGVLGRVETVAWKVKQESLKLESS